MVQFVDFVSKSISAGVEIAESAEGATERTLEIEKIYSSLNHFSSRLEGASRASNSNAPEDTEGLRGLFGELDECLELRAHIRSLEDRLERYQKMISLHFFPLLRFAIQLLS